MADSRHEFVADELWLLVSIVTVALVALAGVVDLDGLAGAISIVGFLLLVPVFLFWGEEVADLLFEPPETAGDDEAVPDDQMADDETSASAETDPLDELKEQYALGRLDDREFERRLERLLALDEVDASDANLEALQGAAAAADRDADAADRDAATADRDTSATDRSAGTAGEESARDVDVEREP